MFTLGQAASARKEDEPDIEQRADGRYRSGNIGPGRGSQDLVDTGNLILAANDILADEQGSCAFAGVNFDRQCDEREQCR